jgi:NAD(P)-dependent dehydrogenase (short-subunit alcohol dehydrogenase family)
LLEHIPVEMFDTAQHIASRGPFLVAKEVLPAMRKNGAGSLFFSNKLNGCAEPSERPGGRFTTPG